jgi:hypothetical protein
MWGTGTHDGIHADRKEIFFTMTRDEINKKENKMEIDNLTIKEIKHINSLLRGSEVSHPYQVGKPYFIRTVTHHYTGLLVKVTPKELVLQDAAWIADDGRFMNALKYGTLNEIEPFQDDVIIGRGAVIDATVWRHKLPRDQK